MAKRTIWRRLVVDRCVPVLETLGSQPSAYSERICIRVQVQQIPIMRLGESPPVATVQASLGGNLNYQPA